MEGFVLAGGRSRRFGSDKALARYRGRALLSWSLRALRGAGLEPRVVTPEIDRYRRFRAAFVSNEEPGLGPVEGVRAALAACRARWALILSVDMPAVTPAVLRALMARPRGAALVLADGTGRLQPFPGLYHRSVLAAIRRRGDRGSMHGLLASVETTALGPADLPARARGSELFRNVNRPGDLPMIRRHSED